MGGGAQSAGPKREEGTVFLAAEEFRSRAAARRRYLELRVLLSDTGEAEDGVYNLLVDGSRPVVAIVMPEAPRVELAGHRGHPVNLPAALWHSLVQRHEAGRATGPFERHFEPGEPIR